MEAIDVAPVPLRSMDASLGLTTPTLPDWSRLQQALTVELEHDCGNLQGRQYRFHEFLALQFHQVPAVFQGADQDQWRSFQARFQTYDHLSPEDRRHLVVQTRHLLHQLRRRYDPDLAPPASSPEGQKAPRVASPKTKPLQGPNHHTAVVPELQTPLAQVNGIGPKAAQGLGALGLFTVRDLLSYYPRDYLDYGRHASVRDLTAGETVTIVGLVKACKCFTSPKNPKLTIFQLTLRDRTGQITISRFYFGSRYSHRGWQESQKKLYPPGSTVAACGYVKDSKYGKTLEEPEIELLDQPQGTIESQTIGRVVPVYSLVQGISADLVRRSVIAVLPAAQRWIDPLPDSLRHTYSLIPLSQALQEIHFPTTPESLAAARTRLVFDEFFYLQLGLLRRRQQQRRDQAQPLIIPQSGSLIDRFYQHLPFQLTQAQQRVVTEILADLAQPKPMNRLVQGDVGSGKTVVAVIALLAALEARFQGALMAPTEVLAEQHYHKLVTWFNLLHLPVELLTGSTKAKKRREILSQVATGEVPLLVGTHALIQDGVEFQTLGLVVIDEQHRFGVAQRAKLQQKGNQPHVLSMTATPIPRTLALTIHGDLDVSQIDELPPGRQAIQTTILHGGRDRAHAYDLIRREVAQGRQAYVVLPLVDESEKLDLKSAIEEYETLSQSVFPNFQVGLLHGRMTSAEKDAVLAQFRQGQTHILVSTTVIEVGVDVPNATVMLIEHAERFGLSQLHQLRGRVGRGGAQSYCLLMNQSRSDQAQERLAVLEQSQDGFFIAEMDLRLRGPGQVLGTRQSGLPDFVLANLTADQNLLELARQAAEQLLAEDETLATWSHLGKELEDRYQRLMGGAIFT